MNDKTKQSIFPITGKVFSNPYDWGGHEFIPKVLGFEPEPGKPYAEYWLGTHPKAPSTIELLDKTTNTLDHLTNLPFLFKLLDAREMLSIQVHPNKKQAEEGYARENAAGIALTDANRTYKDNNHKPEFAIILGDFWLLHGFRIEKDLKQVLSSVPEFASLIPLFAESDYKKLYKHVMEDLSDDEINTMLSALADRVISKYNAGLLEKTNPDYWAAKAIEYMKMTEGKYDRGLFSIYFLNLVNMKPGQAIFQDSGLLHAYLEGPIIEVMANSDNVARGGITPKFVDIQELIKLVIFEGITPHILTGRKVENESFFDAPIEEFAVSSITPTTENSYEHTASSSEILMGLKGNALIQANEHQFSLGQGKSVFIKAGTDYKITGNEGDVIYKTSVPIKK